MEYLSFHNGVQMPIFGLGTWDLRDGECMETILEAVVLRYLVQNGIGVIAKSSHKERLRENMGIFDFILEPSDIKEIEKLDGKKSLFGWY